jgi:aspartyl-tRNA(Asn)/glutamyl-tRNA(Gln) amidotransferase subunit A
MTTSHSTKDAIHDVHRYSAIAEVSGLVRHRKLSPIELVRECLERIEELNPKLNAFITVTADQALEQAKRAEAEIVHSRWRGPLHGIPVGVKDFFDTAGVKTTAAFEPFKSRVPAKDAEVVTRLKKAGAIIVGKMNMHVLGMGTTSTESFFGPVHNPWNVHYVAGGSSGGSAAAIAAGLCYATVDTDAIGSCRLPASCCGVTGFKPTFGLVSTQGILEGEPVDEDTARTIAWIGHTAFTCRGAEDAAIVLSAIATPGVGPRASLADYRKALGKPQKARIGAATNYKATQVVRNAFQAAKDVIRASGHELVDIEVPFGAATFDLKAIEADRRAIAGSLFKNTELLILPTTTDVPASIAEVKVSRNAQAISPDNTFFCNYFGLPAVSLPCGFSQDGLPLGFQVVGPPWSEELVLNVAYSFQQTTNWHLKHPID